MRERNFLKEAKTEWREKIIIVWTKRNEWMKIYKHSATEKKHSLIKLNYAFMVL